ncbi:MAG TPA: YhdP family protein [Dokdonella sp.]
MTVRRHARLRRLRFAAMAAFAAVVILLGVLAGLTQLAMPWLERHPQHVERWLSQRLGRDVHVARLSGTWAGAGPRLSLDEVTITGRDAAQAPFAIPHAELVFDLYALFARNRAFSEFRLSGLELALVDDGGEWRLRGLDFAPDAGSDRPFSMGALGALEVTDLKLTVDDPARALHLALAAPVVRVLNRGDTLRVLGRVHLLDGDAAALDLVAEFDPNARSGTLYLGGADVDLGRLAAHHALSGVEIGAGRGEMRVWARVDAARVEDLRLRVDLHDAQFTAAAPLAVGDALAVAPRFAFDRFAFAARWLRQEHGWTFDLADFVAEHGADARAGAGSAPQPARLDVECRGEDEHPTCRAGVQALPLEPLGDFAMLVDRVPDGLRRWLYLAHPRGTLAGAELRWNGADDYDVDARLRGVALADAGFAPGVEHLDADLSGDAQALLLELPVQPLRVDYAHVFRAPFLFSRFGGDVVVSREDDAWRIATDRLAFEGEDYGGELRGHADLYGARRPSLDLYASVTHGDVAAAKRFWPTTVMPPKAIAWLDRALVGGRLVEGRAAIRGDLENWPFHDLAGRFAARGEVADLALEYDPSWPRAEKTHAFVDFVNDGMHVEADAGESLGNRISAASATIADFGPLVLDLDLKGSGSGASLLGFLRATPIGKRYQAQLKDVEIGGEGAVALKLNLPIKQIESSTLDGAVELTGAALDDHAYGLHFDAAAGRMRFDRKGFAADALEVGFRGRRARLSLAIGGDVADARHVLEARLGGRYPAAAVFADVPELAPVLAKAPGESVWNAGVDVDADGARTHLVLSSDLLGTAIALPAPLAKSADAALPFRIAFDLPYAGQIFVASLGTLAVAKGRLPGPGKPFAARVEFGPGPPGEPPAQGLAVGGRVAELDVGGWLDLVPLGDAGGGAATGALLQRIDLHAGDFVFGGRHFGETQLGIASAAGVTELHLDGAAIAGVLGVPMLDLAHRGISAKFDRIHWPDAPPGAPDTNALSDVAPASLPPLHLAVDDFRLGSASFGAAVFESHPIANGMHVDRLESSSPNITMKSRGEWTGNAKDNRSHLAIELSAQSLGRMMDALGFAGMIDGGTTRATIDASWRGPPSAFALPNLDGTLDVSVAEGRILDVEPGAGRIFGLLSLAEIPRRLSLDFSDFFRSGLSFNSITGKFRLADGNAYTDGLTIRSPAADIVVTGRTGLRAKDYDQRMNVSPHAGATLPLVGALAAGPVGAAAGFVVQGILRKPIGRAVALHYTVTGSWEKPKITLVSRESARGRAKAEPAAPAPAPAGGLR